MKDFLERDEKTFVKAKSENRLGWEENIDKQEGYSKYLLGDVVFSKPAEVLSCAYKLACSVISTITYQPVKVRVDPRNNYATATKQIVISTQVLEEDTYDNFEKIDVMLGEAAHEAAHIAYTDFDLLSFPSTPQGDTKHAICNILEDERIEILIGEQFAGYSRFLEKVKYYFFSKLYLQSMPDYSAMSESKRLFNLFFSLIRYPKYIREQDLTEFALQVKQITAILTPYPQTNREIKEAVEKIYALLKDHHEKKQASEPNGSLGPKENTPFSDEVRPLVEAVNKILSSGMEPGIKKSVTMSKLIAQNPIEALLLEGEAEKGKSKETFFFKEKGDRFTYERVKSEVSAYAGTLSTLLQLSHKDYRVTHKNLRAGYLDTSKLAEGYMGVETIYETHQTIKSKEIAIALLIDESGSMSGAKLREARKCGILFKEALSKAKGITSFIYGHTAGLTNEKSTDIYIYAEGNYQPKYALGSMEARDSNRDGVAILETAKRIRRFCADPCVLFVISDGQPNAYHYSGQAAIKHTKESVAQAERMGFTVIQIAIEAHVPSEKMFTHFVKLTSIATLPRDLGAVLKKAVQTIRN